VRGDRIKQHGEPAPDRQLPAGPADHARAPQPKTPCDYLARPVKAR
jgi:hypothetical protein